MVTIIGKYQHERNENVEEFFEFLGVPYLARQMILISHPMLEISNEGDQWRIKNITLISTQEAIFIPDVEYEEVMPSGAKLKSVTTFEGNSLVTVSKTEDNNRIVRRYDFSDDQVIETMFHEKSDRIAKRYFKRLP